MGAEEITGRLVFYFVVFLGVVAGTVLFFIIRSKADIDKDEEVPQKD
jgi:hypothetical protein